MPRPCEARWLVVECLDPFNRWRKLVDRALAMPPRKMSEIPLSELLMGSFKRNGPIVMSVVTHFCRGELRMMPNPSVENDVREQRSRAHFTAHVRPHVRYR